MPSYLGLAALAGGSFISVFLLIPITRRVALAYDVIAVPDSARLHPYPIPCLGGVAIALTALGGSTFLPGWTVEAVVIFLGAVLVGVVGLIDDVRRLQPMPRLAAETATAIGVVLAGVKIGVAPEPYDSILTVLWLVAITNSFNLLDNMDGAAGIIATVVALALLWAAVLSGQQLVAGMAALIFGSSLGFLVFNWHPATIFMGDAGSLFLGFLIGAAALKVELPATSGTRLMALVLLLGAAVFDTTLVLAARIRSHRPLYLGATDHTSHRLLRAGLTTPAAAVILACGSSLFAGLGLALGRGISHVAVIGPVAGVVFVAGLALALRLPDGPEQALSAPDAERRQTSRTPSTVSRPPVPVMDPEGTPGVPPA